VCVALTAGVLLCAASPAAAAPVPRVIVGVLPAETTVADLADVPGMSVGVMSTGIGEVPPEQTYLDVSQGNRIDEALYDRPLPPVSRTFLSVPGWSQIARRAAAAPADVVPGLLGSSLLDAGIRPEPVPGTGTASLMVVDRSGEIGRVVGGEVGVGVFSAGIRPARRLARAQAPNGLMVLFAEPSAGRRLVPVGISGAGFRGNLRSDSTRTDGYVISTDLAPTILRRLGLGIPDEMNGEPIHGVGSLDVSAVDDLASRMSVIPDRREPLLIACLAAWVLAGFLVSRLVFSLRRVAMAWLGLCFAYMPLLLLAGAWLEPSAVAEGLLVGLGSAILASLTARLAGGWRGLAIACAVTVCAYGIDVIAGSGLTRLSLLGPNPIFGARFYGIGNELEALFAVMVPAGVGAGLSAHSGWAGANTGWGRGASPRVAAGWFLAVAAAASIVFAAGRFGADVGAAIVLPVGAVVAAAMALGDLERFPGSGPGNRSRFRRRVLAVVATPFIAVLLLALIDLATGGDSHLTRSVLDAGSGDLGDIAQRRLELSAGDFSQAAANPLFWLVVVGIVVAVARWRRIDAWLDEAPSARAGLIGACAAVAVGVLVNDSGASFLVLGGIALGAFLAFIWAQSGEIRTTGVITVRAPGK
jgi:hypothetical protein